MATNASRDPAIDTLRVLATLGVIWFHIPGLPLRQVGFGGLVIFLLFSSSLIKPRDSWRAVLEYILHRGKLLLLPWVFWFVVYLILNHLTGRPLLPNGNSLLAGILSGPWIGLWYLPFAAIFVAVANLILFLSRDQEAGWIAVLSVALGAGALFLAYELRSRTDLSPPLAQWVHAAPCLFFGVFLSALRRLQPMIQKTGQVSVTAALVLALVSTSQEPDFGLLLPYLTAFSLISVIRSVPRIVATLSTYLAPLALGVYLIHGAVIALCFRLAPDSSRTTIFAAVVVIAYATSLLLNRIPILKRFC